TSAMSRGRSPSSSCARIEIRRASLRFRRTGSADMRAENVPRGAGPSGRSPDRAGDTGGVWAAAEQGACMATLPPPGPVRVPMVRQEWGDVAFVHWPFEPGAITPLVPSALEVDTFDGAAWVTLVPFSTTCEVFGVVPLPGPARFPETNVRTYVRGPDG